MLTVLCLAGGGEVEVDGLSSGVGSLSDGRDGEGDDGQGGVG